MKASINGFIKQSIPSVNQSRILPRLAILKEVKKRRRTRRKILREITCNMGGKKISDYEGFRKVLTLAYDKGRLEVMENFRKQRMQINHHFKKQERRQKSRSKGKICGRRKSYFISRKRRSITLLEDFRENAASPSDRSRMEVKALGW